MPGKTARSLGKKTRMGPVVTVIPVRESVIFRASSETDGVISEPYSTV